MCPWSMVSKWLGLVTRSDLSTACFYLHVFPSISFSLRAALEFMDGLKIVLWKYNIVLKAIVFSEVKIKKKNLFLAVLDLRCCAGFSLVLYSGGYFLVSECRLLLLQSTGSRILGVQKLQHMGSVAVAPGL